MFLNPNLFFMFLKENLIVWDYKNGQQFEIEENYLTRLMEIARYPASQSELDAELVEADLIQEQAASDAWGWDCLAKIFHFGTKIKRGDLADMAADDASAFSSNYLQYSEERLATSPPLYVEKSGACVALPQPDLALLAKQKYLSVLQKRKTCREFYQQAIKLDVLSTLLHVSFGQFHTLQPDTELNVAGLRKTSPAGGGLHASEAYLLALNIEGLHPGIYHYQAHTHALTSIKSGNFSEQLTEIFCGQHYVENLAMGVFITSRFEKLWHKYPHSRAYRVALLDVGHLSQTFQLTATALNLKPWLSGAFLDDEVNTLLELPEHEQTLFFVGAGHGSGSAIDAVTKQLVQDD